MSLIKWKCFLKILSINKPTTTMNVVFFCIFLLALILSYSTIISPIDVLHRCITLPPLHCYSPTPLLLPHSKIIPQTHSNEPLDMDCGGLKCSVIRLEMKVNWVSGLVKTLGGVMMQWGEGFDTCVNCPLFDVILYVGNLM